MFVCPTSNYLKLRSALSYGVGVMRGKVLALLLLLLAAPVSAEPLKLLAFGDSLTHGYGLPQGDGFVPQMEAWLRAEGLDVAVTNAGVSGDTTAGGLSRIDWTLAEPFDAMILTLGGNDLLRGTAPEVTRANMDGILQAVQGAGLKVLLIGMPAPGNYGPEYEAAFNAIWPELSAQYGTAYVPSFFIGLPDDDPAKLRGLFQPDGIHPNAEGVALIVEGLGPEVAKLLVE
ncbi:Esterase TesA precursor [Thalassovita mediterranea]|uniref:Esterase TesA n=2 Tax=Thalassovita mediterranea TaxID=340021 RepID=A0A0P1GPY7_9RHOB|nr:Esterase TesA precursor [Thalassovita mediterranea]SIS32383.1 acyl-CoA thioesterase-1 [Thalassovita mediterranea]